VPSADSYRITIATKSLRTGNPFPMEPESGGACGVRRRLIRESNIPACDSGWGPTSGATRLPFLNYETIERTVNDLQSLGLGSTKRSREKNGSDSAYPKELCRHGAKREGGWCIFSGSLSVCSMVYILQECPSVSPLAGSQCWNHPGYDVFMTHSRMGLRPNITNPSARCSDFGVIL
jgi:hypothetical protein